MTVLLDGGPRQHWKGSRALAVYRCPNCGTPLEQTFTAVQPALFAHGGYGGADITIDRRCACAAVSVLETATTDPRPYR